MRLIDADKLEIRQGWVTRGFPQDVGGTYDYVRYVDAYDIKNAKAYDFAPKGKWVQAQEQPFFRKHFHTVVCSECNHKGYEIWKYCPNCGAKMDGERKEDAVD